MESIFKIIPDFGFILFTFYSHSHLLLILPILLLNLNSNQFSIFLDNLYKVTFEAKIVVSSCKNGDMNIIRIIQPIKLILGS